MHEENDYSRFMPPSERPQPETRENNVSLPEEACESRESGEATLIVEEVALPEEATEIKPGFGLANRFVAGVARFFYDFFNPFLIASYLTLLLFEMTVLALTAPGASVVYTVTVLGATAIVPAIALVFMRRFGAISALSMPLRSERFVPYVLALLTLGAITLLLAFRGAPLWLWLIYAGGCVAIMANMLINIKIRVSNHATAMAAFIAALVIMQTSGMSIHPLGWWAIGAVIVAGIVGSAAMLLGRHSLLEVAIGYATGFLSVILLGLIH